MNEAQTPKDKGSFNGARLREQRRKAGLTQKDLALALGINQSAVCDYERGRSSPSCGTLARMALTLHTSADYLLGLADDPTPSPPDGALTPSEKELLGIFQSLPYGKSERVIGSLMGLRDDAGTDK